MTTHYTQNRKHSNWTGITPRQSRITGYFAESKKHSDRIPAYGYVGVIIILALIFGFVPFLSLVMK